VGGFAAHTPPLVEKWLHLTRTGWIFAVLHQKVGNFKIQLFIDIPGFIRFHYEHKRAVAESVAAPLQGFTRENIEAGILFIYRRQVLGLEQDVWIVVHGLSMLVI
jgi:hypothetical protein